MANIPASRRRLALLEITNSVLVVLEGFVFIYYFKIILKLKFLNHAPSFFLSATLTLTIMMCILINNPKTTKDEIVTFSLLLNILEFFVLLLLCLTYFYKFVKTEVGKSISLKDTPSFIIITGLFFYIIISLPFFLVGSKLAKFENAYYLMYSIHYVSLSILFLGFEKAFRCKTPLTTWPSSCWSSHF